MNAAAVAAAHQRTEGWLDGSHCMALSASALSPSVCTGQENHHERDARRARKKRVDGQAVVSPSL